MDFKVGGKNNWRARTNPCFYGIAPTLGGYDTGSISDTLVETQFNKYFHQSSNILQGGITGSI